MKGFYFGGSMIDKAYLRASILYYDYIMHYDVAKFFKPFDTEWPIAQVIKSFYRDTKIFRDEKLLRLIPVSAWVGKYGDVFSSLIENNFSISHPDLDQLASLTENRRLIYFHDFIKIPASEWPKYEKRMKEVTPEKAGIEPEYSEQAISRLVSNEPGYFSKTSLNEVFRPNIRMAAGRETVYGLIGSIEFNAVPFTDIEIYAKYLDYLLYRLSNTIQIPEDHIKQEFQVRAVTEALRIGVPSFENLPDEELLRFRNQRKDELSAFRHVIDELAEEIQSVDISDNGKRHLQSIIRSKVTPKISALKEVVEEKVTESKKKRIENIAIATVNLAAFAYLPFEALVLPTILALAKFSTDEIGILIEKQKYKKNGLYILWDLQKISSKAPR